LGKPTNGDSLGEEVIFALIENTSPRGIKVRDTKLSGIEITFIKSLI